MICEHDNIKISEFIVKICLFCTKLFHVHNQYSYIYNLYINANIPYLIFTFEKEVYNITILLQRPFLHFGFLPIPQPVKRGSLHKFVNLLVLLM